MGLSGNGPVQPGRLSATLSVTAATTEREGARGSSGLSACFGWHPGQVLTTSRWRTARLPRDEPSAEPPTLADAVAGGAAQVEARLAAAVLRPLHLRAARRAAEGGVAGHGPRRGACGERTPSVPGTWERPGQAGRRAEPGAAASRSSPEWGGRTGGEPHTQQRPGPRGGGGLASEAWQAPKC